MDPGAPIEPGRNRLTGRPIDGGQTPRFSPQARQPVKKRGDGEWSQPRRFEAYPTIGRRMRIGEISPVLVGAFVLAVVALLLFLLPGFLSGGGVTAPRVTPTPSITASPAPTPTPAPTPQTYVVKQGDTLSKIAPKLGVTIDQIACYNHLTGKQIDSLSIGQVLLIPPVDYECPAPTLAPTKTPKST